PEHQKRIRPTHQSKPPSPRHKVKGPRESGIGEKPVRLTAGFPHPPLTTLQSCNRSKTQISQFLFFFPHPCIHKLK
ncbi:MAG: hypothetical protein ACK55Z_27525, partial [bacterium]